MVSSLLFAEYTMPGVVTEMGWGQKGFVRLDIPRLPPPLRPLAMDMIVMTITCNISLALDNGHYSHLRRADTDGVEHQNKHTICSFLF